MVAVPGSVLLTVTASVYVVNVSPPQVLPILLHTFKYMLPVQIYDLTREASWDFWMLLSVMEHQNGLLALIFSDLLEGV